MKRALLPTVCIAVLSTVAFEEKVFAAQSDTLVSENTMKTTTQYVTISSGFLNVRENASTSSSVVTTLNNGTEVTVYSQENGWSKVKVNGKVGFVSSKYLTSAKTNIIPSTKASTAKTTTKYVNVSSGSLNLRKSASTSADIVTTIKQGTAVTVYSEENGWAKIIVSGKEGYVSSKYITSTKPETGFNTIVMKTTTKYVNVNSGSLNLRNSATTSADIVTTIKKGTAVTVYSEENGWAKIKANEKEGYVSSKYLSSTKLEKNSDTSTPTMNTTTKYVNVSSGSLNLRKSATTSADIVTTIKKGTAVTVYSEENGWAKIKANGKEGYVSSKYLISDKSKTDSDIPALTEKTITKYVNVSNGSLNVRKSATTSAGIVATIKKGTAVTVYSEDNGWSMVKVNGKEGYVSTQYLTSTKTESNSSPSASPAKMTIKYVKVNSGSLNMRKSASTTASIIVKEVKVYSESAGWAKIEAFGQIGYVSSQYLSTKKYNETSNTPSQITKTMYVNVNTGSSLNFRKNASSSAIILAKLTNGKELSVHSKENGWAMVTVDGQKGYVSAEYLTSVKPSTIEKTDEQKESFKYKYVNVSIGSSLNMRTKASANSSVIVKLANGVEIKVYSDANGWAQVEAYGKVGYVSSQYLLNTKPSGGEGSGATIDNSTNNNEIVENETISKYVNVMIGSTLNMRSEPSTSASVMTKLTRSTMVTVYSEENNWAKVTVNGQTGYVSSQYLSNEEPYSPGTNDKDNYETYNKYDITLDELTGIQMLVNPQTDKTYETYIREDALTINSSSRGTVRGTSWNVRGGAGTNYWVVGTVRNGDSVEILSKVIGEDGYIWYEINYNKSWVNASPDDVKYYLDPGNFTDTSVDSLQFLKLSVPANLNANEVNESILAGKGILDGLATAFITAGEAYHVNEIYLISHALLETGYGTSQLANGVLVNGKRVYNMYGIGAYDGSAVTSGAKYAYNAGWFTPEAAIIGGAKFIAQGYISGGQDTLYKMRWNPASAIINGDASHQYATDIGWAAKQVKQIYNLYSLIDSYNLVLDIPEYNKY
jgi:beta-N-acetylglucosaminidase/uncharacterized protein YgiM (DUF1202 family)